MKTTCETCAFNSGTSANRNGLTVIKATLCVENRVPFYCHAPIEELERAGVPLEEAMQQADGSLPLCRGYVEAVRKLKETGYYDGKPEWQKRVTDVMLEAIDKAENGGMTEDDCIQFVVNEIRRLNAEQKA